MPGKWPRRSSSVVTFSSLQISSKKCSKPSDVVCWYQSGLLKIMTYLEIKITSSDVNSFILESIFRLRHQVSNSHLLQTYFCVKLLHILIKGCSVLDKTCTQRIDSCSRLLARQSSSSFIHQLEPFGRHYLSRAGYTLTVHFDNSHWCQKNFAFFYQLSPYTEILWLLPKCFL